MPAAKQHCIGRVILVLARAGMTNLENSQGDNCQWEVKAIHGFSSHLRNGMYMHHHRDKEWHTFVVVLECWVMGRTTEIPQAAWSHVFESRWCFKQRTTHDAKP